MKSIRYAGTVAAVYLLTASQAFASHCPSEVLDCQHPAVPEIDGSGAIIAIGLVAGLVALIREKFFRR